MQLRLSPTVKILLIACIAAFVVQQTIDQFFGGHLLEVFALVPKAFFEGRIWQLATYPFLHGDPLHLILNLMMLAFIASDLEFKWGRRRFLTFYFFCAAMAGILYLLLQLWVWRDASGITQPMVGASGAIYGCLMAYGLLFGERVLLFMMLFPMKAKYFIWVLAGVEFLSSAFSGRGGLASAAHLGGMMAGVGYLWWMRYRAIAAAGKAARPGGAKKKLALSSKKKHLKLIVDNDPDDDRDPNDMTWH